MLINIDRFLNEIYGKGLKVLDELNFVENFSKALILDV